MASHSNSMYIIISFIILLNSCFVVNSTGIHTSENNFYLRDLVGPHISRHSLSSLQFKLGTSLKLFCEAEGNPPPIITWYKNDAELRTDPRITFRVEEGRSYTASHMNIILGRITDVAEYECVATNKNGATIRRFKTRYVL